MAYFMREDRFYLRIRKPLGNASGPQQIGRKMPNTPGSKRAFEETISIGACNAGAFLLRGPQSAAPRFE